MREGKLYFAASFLNFSNHVYIAAFPPKIFLGLRLFKMKRVAVFAFPYLFKSVAAIANCSNSFEPISAKTWVNGVNPGWNLGNTLDAVPTEGSWNNPPVDFSTFDDVKGAGFKGIRLPGSHIEKEGKTR